MLGMIRTSVPKAQGEGLDIDLLVKIDWWHEKWEAV